jgi:hypothetical protein
VGRCHGVLSTLDVFFVPILLPFLDLHFDHASDLLLSRDLLQHKDRSAYFCSKSAHKTLNATFESMLSRKPYLTDTPLIILDYCPSILSDNLVARMLKSEKAPAPDCIMSDGDITSNLGSVRA